MVRHNNIIPNQHFHKKWQRRVKCWFGQPVQKKLRRDKRKEKAAAIAPRPAGGALRPLVHCPTQKYNSKIKLGRGFTLEELKTAGINAKFAQTVGIAVDHRRINKCNESLTLNVDRLKDYKSRLVVFPRQLKKTKNGDSDKAAVADAKASQLKTKDVIPMPKPTSAVSYITITDEMKAVKGYSALRVARNEKRLLGRRIKKKKEADADQAAK